MGVSRPQAFESPQSRLCSASAHPKKANRGDASQRRQSPLRRCRLQPPPGRRIPGAGNAESSGVPALRHPPRVLEGALASLRRRNALRGCATRKAKRHVGASGRTIRDAKLRVTPIELRETFANVGQPETFAENLLGVPGVKTDSRIGNLENKSSILAAPGFMP